MILQTSRLSLRRWLTADREPFAALNADPEVMAHVGPPLDRAASDALAEEADRSLGREGYGFWAVEVLSDGRFAGLVGLQPRDGDGPGFALTWRLGRWAWGQGYAVEAVEAVLEVAFLRLDAPEVVAVIRRPDDRSRALASRLAMTPDAADGVYVLSQLDWLARRTSAPGT